MSTDPENQNRETIDLRALMCLFWARRLWITISVTLSVVVFAFAAFHITPEYRAKVVLVPASAERKNVSSSLNSALSQLGGLASLAGISVGSSDAETEEALAVLRSRQFTGDFISDQQLLPELFRNRWNPSTQQWKADGKPAPTLGKGYEYFDKRIRSIVQDRKTGLVTVQVDWKDRNEAAAWANELVERLNAEMRARAIAKADAALGYLEKEQATTIQVPTRDAISRLIEAEIRQRMLADVTREYAFSVVDRALAPDADDPVRPNKPLLIIVGLVVGLVIGTLGAVIAPPRR
jgi:capsular polysaccharide biosynthesis protein